MRKWPIFFLLFSFNSFAQEVPEHMENLLKSSQEYFEIYIEKTPAQIDDGVYDESEYLLFSQLDQISGYNVIFSKEEIKNVKCRMVFMLSDMFTSAQLQAMIKIAKSKELNKISAVRYFEVALEYKSGLITTSLVKKYLAPNYFYRR